MSLIYTDDTDDLADGLKIELQDRDGLWRKQWLEETVETAAGGMLELARKAGIEGVELLL